MKKKIDEKHSTVALAQSREYHHSMSEPRDIDDMDFVMGDKKKRHKIERHRQAISAASKLLAKRGYK